MPPNLQKPDIPVVAYVYKGSKLIAKAENTREAENDISGHAEINALRLAARAVGSWKLSGCELVSSLEPCPMCAWAAVDAQISKISFAAYDSKKGACGSVWDLPRDPQAYSKIEVTGGISFEGKSSNEVSAELRDFFKKVRNGD